MQRVYIPGDVFSSFERRESDAHSR